MIAPYFVYPILKFKYNMPFEESLIIIVAWSTAVWVVVTLLTRPTRDDKLKSFYKKVHPGGLGWIHISKNMPDVKGDTGYRYLFINWIAGCVMVMFCLFGIGKIIFGELLTGSIFIGISIFSGGVIYYNLSKIGWKKVID